MHLWVSVAVGYLQQVEGVPQGGLLQRQGEGQGELCRQAVRKHLAGGARETENHSGEVSRRSSEQDIQLLEELGEFSHPEPRCSRMQGRNTNMKELDLLSAALQGVSSEGRQGKALVGVTELR